MQSEAQMIAEIKMVAWMQIEDDSVSVDEAVEQLKDMGNRVLEVDTDNRRIKVADQTIQQEDKYAV